ncbi:MAG: tRNA preQ1(34) S-adenosylmethionine ribosyltransferase-isomerase QueA [Vampirovibrionia bacterium]
MKVEDFNYHLPPEMIAQHPSEKRDNSKMMVINRENKTITHKYFKDITDYITTDDLIIINNTKVIPARVFGQKDTGANIEIFLIQSLNHTTWQCLLRPQKRIKPGIKIYLKDNQFITVEKQDAENKWIIKTPEDFENQLNSLGNMPLPPYIKREKENIYKEEDKNRYQTVYAKIPGAVAAPTAGLHFTPEIINTLKNKGTKFAEVTLHVGLGTFKPVQCENIQDHIMHEEFYTISKETAELIDKQKKEGKRIIPIGTTSIRTLETVAKNNNGQIKADSGWSNIFIYPGFNFNVTDACITNFHLPKSTLIMLISALASKELVFKAYEEAIKEKYRFYSYGDCMLIEYNNLGSNGPSMHTSDVD